MAALPNFANITRVPELRRRVLFTLGMLAIYRIGVFVTVPGVNRNVMRTVVSKQGGLFGFMNLFSGGALENLSIFALGIMPYVSASIIFQLLGMVYKPIDELRKEGEQGRRKIDQYTRMATVVLSAFQAFGIGTYLEGLSSDAGEVVGKPGLAFRLMTIITLTTGTAFLMWVGEQITERGISNGISLLIFAGIVDDIPSSIGNYLQQNKGNVQPLTVAAVLAVILVTVATIVFFERAQRQIPIVYSRRQVGKRIYGGQQAHLPLKVNTAGTIPPIFASSLLAFPATLATMGVWGMDFVRGFIDRGDWVFNTFYVLLIVFFCFFYTAVTFQAVDVADNLKKQQANIPGIRPGQADRGIHRSRPHAHHVRRRDVRRRGVRGADHHHPSVPRPLPLRWHLDHDRGRRRARHRGSQIEAQLITRQYEGGNTAGAPRIRARRDATG